MEHKGRPCDRFVQDESPAITANKFGKGTIVTVLLDAWTAAQTMPELARDVLDLWSRNLFDI